MPFVQRDGGGAVIAVFENRQPFATEELAADLAEVKQVRERPAPPPDDSRTLLARAVKLVAEGKPLPVDLHDKLATLAQADVADIKPEPDAIEGALP